MAKTYGLFRSINEDGFDNKILTKTLITTSESENRIKLLISDLQKKFSIAFLDGNINAMTRYKDGFSFTYQALYRYRVTFFCEEVDKNNMKMLDYLEFESSGVL